MAWYYFNDAREKIGPMTSKELKQLVQQGTITPETFVEDPDGRTGLAKDVKGLPFTDVSPFNGNTRKSEPNYFYFDASGYKHGPVSTQQLKDLAAQGAVNPNTPMETDTGHKGTAGQIPNLFAAVSPFSAQNESVPSPAAALADQAAQAVRTHGQRAAKSAMLWLFDFAFRDIRIHVVNLWLCRVIYVLCWIAVVISALWGTFGCFRLASEVDNPLPILFIPLVWLSVLIQIFFIRLFLEFCIVLLDWMVETSKAARLYIEEKSGEK